MPYSIFFNYTTRAAIHGGEVPSPRLRIGYATHGCIHVKEPDIKWLYDWTEEAGLWWLSPVGERRIKESHQFSVSASRARWQNPYKTGRTGEFRPEPRKSFL